MDQRKEICRIGRKIYEKGLVAATDGNISYKIAPNRILITPSGVSKGELSEYDLLTIDPNGKVISGKGKPSSETLMHLAVYKARPEINAVIHAHPPITTALTVAGVSLAQCIIPEVVITMGSIPLAEYATPCTADGARVVNDLIHETDAIILDRHGSLTIGETLQAAFFKLEKLEHAAHVTATAKTLGNVKILPKEEVQKLIELRHKLGIKSKTNPCSTCSNCRSERPADIDENALVNLVTEEILKKFAEQK